LATDIDAHAKRVATANGMIFRHVIYVNVYAVKQIQGLDVFIEPVDEDRAHANLVAYGIPMAHALTPGQPLKISQDFMRGLVSVFSVCDAANLMPIEQLRQ
jgi:hypothetical protein